MLADLGTTLVWWAFIFGLGVIYLPLAQRLFSRFFDQGYLFAKVLAVLFTSYSVWLAGSLKILPFYQESVWLAVVVGLAFNLWLASKDRRPRFDLGRLRVYLLEELLFLTALIFWAYVRGFQPAIQGLEKFMDFGFVNSILRSQYFPPADMWFAGESINYYYFGHLVTALLTKLTGINSAIAYNLMLATLFAFCFSLVFSLTGNLVYLWQKKSKYLVVIAGLISALAISLGANLHPAYYNLKMTIFSQPYCDGATTYWYPNATRYIGYCPAVEDKTIHEFPAYSFVVSDLHGHVSDIPFVLTFLALTLVLVVSIRENRQSFWQLFLAHLPLSLLLAVMYMTNQWDYPIYLLVLGLALLWAYRQKEGPKWSAFLQAVKLGLPWAALSVPLFLPFMLNFQTLAKGVEFVRAHSLFYQLLILWGAPWFFGLTLLWTLFGPKINFKTPLKKEALVKWLANRLGVAIEMKNLPQPSTANNRTAVITSDTFALVLFLVSTLLIIIPEVIYVKDIYIPSYHRANTMFKLTYQSFIMFSVITGYIFIRVLSALSQSLFRKLLLLVYSLLIAALMVYPFYSIKGYYGELKKDSYKGLSGLNFLYNQYPDDYQAVLWLNANVSGQPTLLEAVGDSYTDYERISMATGLPTIEGWLVHEWLWRGSYDEPGKRAAEVQTIYESSNLTQTKNLLKQYQVKYVIVGGLERQKYPNINEGKLATLGKQIFQSGNTVIYQID